MKSLDASEARGLPGIDVSHYQQAIDWLSVARSGIKYCFIKATEGSSRLDQFFHQNWQGSAEAGIARGAYHFFHPAAPVTAQVDFFLRTVPELQPGELPPVLDLEVPQNWTGIPPSERGALALNWLNAVEQHLGATPLVYLSPAFMTTTLKNAPELGRFPLWLAHYTTAMAPAVPKPWTSWTFWQHTGQGKTPGVSGYVDLNWFNGTLDNLKSLTRSVREISDSHSPGTQL